MTRTASTSATRSIRARTCSTARPSRCSSTRSKATSAASINYDPSHFLLQQLDYLDFIDIYHERIKAFHVKDAEFNPTGRQGVYSGYQRWVNRAGRFRSLGDGQVDFGGIFSKLAQYDYDCWAVLEWECCLKHPEDGAREGAPSSSSHIIRVTEKAFDDFAGGSDRPQDDARCWGLRLRQRLEQRAMATVWRGSERWPSKGERTTKAGTGGSARHGRRRAGRLHRRGAPASRRAWTTISCLVAGALSSDPEHAPRLRRRSSASSRHRSYDSLRDDGRRRRPARRTASRRWRSSRRTICTRRPPRPSSRPASMSSATSR